MAILIDIPLPKTPDELERVVEEIYTAKPWDGLFYRFEYFIVRWPLTLFSILYAIGSFAVPFYIELLLCVLANIVDRAIIRVRVASEEDIKRMLRHFFQAKNVPDERVAMISYPWWPLVKWGGIIQGIIIMSFFLTNPDPHTRFDFLSPSRGVDFFVSLLIYGYFAFSMTNIMPNYSEIFRLKELVATPYGKDGRQVKGRVSIPAMAQGNFWYIYTFGAVAMLLLVLMSIAGGIMTLMLSSMPVPHTQQITFFKLVAFQSLGCMFLGAALWIFFPLRLLAVARKSSQMYMNMMNIECR